MLEPTDILDPASTKGSDLLLGQSRFELNMSEFPVFLISACEEDVKQIVYQDTIKGKGGAIIPRTWTVACASDIGFGGTSTIHTFYEIFQIWYESKFKSQYINFGSIYNLLQRMGKKPDGRNYKNIVRDLYCLKGISIRAKNAFWDPQVKSYVDKAFGIFDEVEIFQEFSQKEALHGMHSLGLSRIKASDVFYQSVLSKSILVAGFTKAIAQSFTPLELRLALYLSKMLSSYDVLKRDIEELATQIPLRVYTKKRIRQQLQRTCNNLISKGFLLLNKFEFTKTEDNKIMITFYANKPNRSTGPRDNAPALLTGEIKETEYLTQEIMDVCGDEKSRGFYIKVARIMDKEMIFRALSEVRGAKAKGEIKTSPGQFFTFLIKELAKENGYKL